MRDVGRVERELDLADEEAGPVVMVGGHDVDLGVSAGRRAPPPGLRGLPARVVDGDVGNAGPDDVLPDLAEVRDPRGFGLDVELAASRSERLGSTKRYQ